jgi:hypothetical protein
MPLTYLFYYYFVAFYVATRVFGSLGFVSSIATTLLVMWFIFKSEGEHGRALFLSMILSFVTGR